MTEIVKALRSYAPAPPADADQRIHVSYWPTQLMLDAAEKIERLEKLLGFSVSGESPAKSLGKA